MSNIDMSSNTLDDTSLLLEGVDPVTSAPPPVYEEPTLGVAAMSDPTLADPSLAATADPTTDPTAVTTIYYHRSYTPTAIGILTGLCFLLACLLAWIGYRIYQERLHRILFGALAEATRTKKQTQRRIDRRYETIEHWLITKRILKHDEFCQRVCCEIKPSSPPPPKDNQNNNNSNDATSADDADNKTSQQGGGGGEAPEGAAAADPTNNSSSNEPASETPTDSSTSDSPPTTPTATTPTKPGLNSQPSGFTTDDEEFDLFGDDDEEDKECPICMNVLRENDTVSWSANMKCNHVYHHECIKEWLLRKTGCPFCRETFLPCDEVRGEHKPEVLREMSKRYASRSSTSYYCIQEGLVQLPPMVRCTLTELETLKDRIFFSALAPSDLVDLRGQRADATTASCCGAGVGAGGGDNGACDLEHGEHVGVAVGGIDLQAVAAGGNIEDPSENPCLDEQDDGLVLMMQRTGPTLQQDEAYVVSDDYESIYVQQPPQHQRAAETSSSDNNGNADQGQEPADIAIPAATDDTEEEEEQAKAPVQDDNDNCSTGEVDI